MTFDITAVQKTQKQINAAIWGCAGIAMTASAIAGITGFWNLQHDFWGLASGLFTSAAVDTALWVALTSDHLMERAGLTADGPWARAVRWGTAVMSIVLNVLAAVLSPLSAAKKGLLIIIHAFAPIIMVGLAELRTENGRKLAMAEKAALADEEARRVADEAKQRALALEKANTRMFTPSERISEEQPWTPVVSNPHTALPPSNGLGLRRPSPAYPSSSFRAVTPLRPAAKPRPVAPSNRRGTPVKDRVFDWLDAHYVHGTTQVGDLVSALGGSKDTYKKHLAEWRKLNEERTKEVAS